MHFVSPDLTARALLKDIEGYVASCYDASNLMICIHGDSAAWIVNAFDEWANISHVINGYHFERDIRRFSRRAANQYENAKEGYKEVLGKLRKLIRHNDRENAVVFANTLAWNEQDESRRKKMENFAAFLNEHWDRIGARQEKGLLGSRTEGCVQHLLACRFTTLPMSWSGKGQQESARSGCIF